ncbi:MAG TPA: 23S rRNA (uracil(1939)-C(5))-methyltransferase RlmD, partial [Vampirovibrionales bacterium]
MGRSKLFETNHVVKIEKLVYGGNGLAKLENGRVVLVPNTVPGEVVEISLRKKKKGVFWADIVEIKQKDESIRIEEKCQHSQVCGGCSYQHLPYNYQLQAKETILKEIYNNALELEPSICSPVEYNYRNKCEFTFGEDKEGNFQLGLHPPGKFFEVLDLKQCELLPRDVWNLLQAIKALAADSGLGPYKDLKDEGFWSTVTIRYGFEEGKILILWNVKNPQHPKLQQINETLSKQFPNIKAIFAIPSPRGELVSLLGDSLIVETIGDLQLMYGVENFFQINMKVLPLFMKRITDLVSERKPLVVYDLFGGVGAIGLYLAKQLPLLKRVISAEVDKEATKLAALNAELNCLENFEAYHLDLYKKGWSKMFLEELGLVHNNDYKNACAIVDPPRAGLAKKTIKDVSALEPSSIVYVSCNPTTQKRDIDLFKEYGYEIQSLQLVDMFPQTFHLEAIAV